MMQNELNHLIKMVNQIAAHCAPGEPSDVAADKAASHLQRFWAPSMKTKIIDYARDDGSALSEVATDAIQRLS
ncbi:MAG: formate dehydrogenase subunit delta [Proteobacteria bacterium]|jgi:hypothetical protein|nr:formate dehydrogenase subunit delta [Pseudomonadota bacterium]MDA1208217.1 formate dehydrogenase subunit delta [Pseudomonadota bacterium]